jgi:hypothetical protein
MPKGKAKIKDPRRLGPVAVAFVQLFKDYGITNVLWGKSTHGWVKFAIDDVPSSKVTFPCTPRCSGHAITLATKKLETEIMNVLAEVA